MMERHSIMKKEISSRIVLKVDVNTNGDKTGKAIIPEGTKVWSFSDYNFRFMTGK